MASVHQPQVNAEQIQSPFTILEMYNTAKCLARVLLQAVPSMSVVE